MFVYHVSFETKKHSELFFAICMSTSSPKMRPHLLAVKYPQHILSETTKRVMFFKNSLRESRSKHFCHPPSSTSEWNQENNVEIKDNYDTWRDGPRRWSKNPGKGPGKLVLQPTHSIWLKETHLNHLKPLFLGFNVNFPECTLHLFSMFFVVHFVSMFF